MWALLKVKTEPDQFHRRCARRLFLLRPEIYRKYLYAYKHWLLSGAPLCLGGEFCSGYYYYSAGKHTVTPGSWIRRERLLFVHVVSSHLVRVVSGFSPDVAAKPPRLNPNQTANDLCEVQWRHPPDKAAVHHGKQPDSWRVALGSNQPPLSPIEAGVFVCSDTWSVWPALALAGSQASSRALCLHVCLRVQSQSNATPRQSKARILVLLRLHRER